MGEIAMVNKPTPARTFRENLYLPSTLDSVQPWDIDDSPWIYMHFAQSRSIIWGRPKWVNEVAPYLLPDQDRKMLKR